MSDTSDIVAYVGGGTGIVGGIVWLVRTLAGRVVQREDDDKKTLQLKVEKSEEREREGRMTSMERERVISEALINIKHDMQGMRSAMDQLKQQVESRAVQQDKEIAELRAEVKEQLVQLEHRLRSDMQRIVSEKPQRRGRA